MITFEESERNVATILAQVAIGTVPPDAWVVFECTTGDPQHSFHMHIGNFVREADGGNGMDINWCPTCKRRNHRVAAKLETAMTVIYE